MALAGRHAALSIAWKRLMGSASTLPSDRIARVIFCPHDGALVALSGVIKKSQKTPQDEIDLALKRKKDLDA